jgi:hypothetical protein
MDFNKNMAIWIFAVVVFILLCIAAAGYFSGAWEVPS